MQDDMNKNLVIALVQHDCVDATADNRGRSEAGLREAAAGGAQVAVLSELHAHRYFCQHRDDGYFELAEPVDGPTAGWLSALARELSIVVVGSIYELGDDGRRYNTALVFEAGGGLAGSYRKMHIPDDPGYYERHYFTPGGQGFVPVDTSAGRLGVMVCWDQWFPEAARAMALAGAEVLIYPTAIGWEPDDDGAEQRRQFDAWTTVQRGHAVANSLPVVACNRVGFEPDPSGARKGIEFWGHSFVAGPQGELLAQAGTAPQVLFAVIDRGRSADVRRVWTMLADRRTDVY